MLLTIVDYFPTVAVNVMVGYQENGVRELAIRCTDPGVRCTGTREQRIGGTGTGNFRRFSLLFPPHAS